MNNGLAFLLTNIMAFRAVGLAGYNFWGWRGLILVMTFVKSIFQKTQHSNWTSFALVFSILFDLLSSGDRSIVHILLHAYTKLYLSAT